MQSQICRCKCRAKFVAANVVAANAEPKLSLQMQSQSCRCKCRAKVVAANAEPKLSLQMQSQGCCCKCRAKVVAANAEPNLSLQMQCQSCRCKCSAKVVATNTVYVSASFVLNRSCASSLIILTILSFKAKYPILASYPFNACVCAS